MRIIAAATLALLPLAATAAQPAEPGADQRAEAPQTVPPGLDRMNVYRSPAGCVPIEQQVARGGRRGGTRLDQQPPGHAFFAVDRMVDGCREVTLIAEEQRRRRGSTR
jgi:hypothetical protein